MISTRWSEERHQITLADDAPEAPNTNCLSDNPGHMSAYQEIAKYPKVNI